MDDATRRARLLELWLQRPEEEHTAETGPLLFFHWVEENYPELLVLDRGDPYVHLRADLTGHLN